MGNEQHEPATSMEIARLLREATRKLMLAHGALDDARRPCGTPLPISHAWAFLELLEEGPMTITTLASRLSIDRTNVSRLCTRMQARGELKRSPHPVDGRAQLVQLTESGSKIARAVDRSSARHFQRVVERLSADPASIVKALHALRKAMNASSTTSGTASGEPTTSKPEPQS